MNTVTREDISEWMTSNGFDKVFFAARSEQIPEAFLVHLSKTSDSKTTRAAIRNKNFPVKELAKGLKLDPYAYLSNQYIPENLIRKTYIENVDEGYYGYRNLAILQRVFSHSNCPADILQENVDSNSADIRASIAENPNLPLPSIVKLLGDEIVRVRSAAIRNPATTEEMLLPLIEGADAKLLSLLVRKFTGDTQREIIATLKGMSPGTSARSAIARYSVDPELAYEMCADESLKVRRAAMRNEITPEEGKVLATLLGVP